MHSTDGLLENSVISKVERITHTGKAVGPGAYNIHDSIRQVNKSPKGVTSWAHSKSNRKEHFVKNSTMP